MITLVDYGAGNITSVRRALERLSVQVEVSADPERIASTAAVIFPGVGAAGQAMQRLQQSGLDQALRDYAASGKPLLGICLGMQILFDFSEEDGGVNCLGILPGRVVRFPEQPGLTVPHMGWNLVQKSKVEKSVKDEGAESQKLIAESAKFKAGGGEEWFYFVHSYYCEPAAESIVTGWTEHGVRFASAVQRDNVTAVQFHPEKSGEAGERFLQSWLDSFDH